MRVSSCFVWVRNRGDSYLCGSGDTSSGNDAAELIAGLLDPCQRALDGRGNGLSLKDVGLEELCGFRVFGNEGSSELLIHVEDSDVAAGLDEVDDTGAAEARCAG